MSTEFNNWENDKKKGIAGAIIGIASIVGVIIKEKIEEKQDDAASYRLEQNKRKVFKDDATKKQMKEDQKRLDERYKYKR